MNKPGMELKAPLTIALGTGDGKSDCAEVSQLLDSARKLYPEYCPDTPEAALVSRLVDDIRFR